MAEIPEWTAALLKGEFEPMRALVRELAESDPRSVDGDGFETCHHCGGAETPRSSANSIYHKPTCLWLRARKLAGMG